MGSDSSTEPTPDQRAMIERKVAEYIRGDFPVDARRAAAEALALPLYLDWSACMALRPDGEVLWVDYDDPDRVRAVEDQRERNIGLFQGSLRDPDLRCMVPPRSPDAVTCPHCRGTGRLSFAEGARHLDGVVVCHCGGLGWLPSSS